MSRQSSAQAYTDQNTCSYVNRKMTISQVLVYIIYCLILFFQKFYFVVEPERPIATVPLVRPGWTICCKFLQLINSIDISFRHKPRSNPTDTHAKPMLYFKPTFLYSNNNQISATVQDPKIRVQVVAPHLS